MAGDNPWEDYAAPSGAVPASGGPWEDFKGSAGPSTIRLADVMRAPSLGDVVGASLQNNRASDEAKIAQADLGRSVGQTLDVPELTPVQAPEAVVRGFESGGGKLLQALGVAQSLAVPSGVSPLQIIQHPELGLGAAAIGQGKQAQEMGAIQPGEYLPDTPSKVAFSLAEQVPTLAGAIATGGASSAEALVPAALRNVPVLGNIVGNIAAGAPTATALTAEQAATMPEDQSLGDFAKSAALNYALAGVPPALGNGQLARTVTGGVIGGGLAAGSNAIEGKPQDTASTLVGAITGAALAGGHKGPEAIDPYLKNYNESAAAPPPLPEGPLSLPAPESTAAAAPEMGNPISPVSPAKFDATATAKAFTDDPRAALDTLDHPTLTQLASDVGIDVGPNDKRVAIISKIAGKPPAFLQSDVLPEYLAAAQDAHNALQAPQPAPDTIAPVEPPVPGLGDVARSLSPSSTVPVDSQGVAYTPEQGAKTLGDAIQAQAGSATRALPPAVTTVDSAGVATNSEAQNRQIAKRLADEQARFEAAKAKRELGITPDIERTQGPRWEQLATNADDLRAMQDAREAQDDEVVRQRTDDAPEWWMAGQHAADDFDRNIVELQQARDQLSQQDHKAAGDVLTQHGIEPQDHDEALAISQLVERAYDAGATPHQILGADQEPDNASRARALWALTNRLEGERNAQQPEVQQAGSPRDTAQDQGIAAAGRTQPEGTAGTGEAESARSVTVPERAGPVAERVKVPDSSDVFGTSASWVIRNKETGEPVMETFERKTAERINHEKYEAVPVAQHLAEINTPGTKQYENRGDVKAGVFPPKSKVDHGELDHVDEASQELSRDQGEADADRLGLRDAVNKALGPAAKHVQFLHGYEGLPQRLYERVKARNSVSRKGNTVAMYRPDTGEVYIFTDRVKSPKVAVWSAAHEIAGHAGLRAFLGDKLDPALNIARKNPTVAKLADAIYEQRNIGEQMKQTGRPHGDGVLLSTEEALAELAAAVRTGDYDKINERYGVEVPPGIRDRIKSVINDFVQRLKALIDDLFGKHTFTDEDVRDLLDEAWKAAQKREAGAAPKPGSELEQVGEPPSDSTPISLQAVRRALEARGMSPEAIAAMSRDQLRAEQASLRARSEPTPQQQEALKTTGINNATKEEERAMAGKAAVEHDLQQSNPEQYARAKAAFDADPHAGQILAAKVIANPKAITPEQSILLSLDAMRIINARQSAYEQAEKAQASGDMATKVAAQSLIKQLDGQMEANDIAARYSGTKAGQALQARKVMIQQDYSMARMMLRAKVAKGEPLTDAERSKVEAASAEIAKRTAELDAREAKLRAMEAEARPAQVKRQARAKFDDLVAQLKKIPKEEHLKPGCVV